MSARPDEPHVGLIVEGRGDFGSVPVLLRKHLHERGEFRDILGQAVNIKGIGNATKEKGIEGFVSAVGNRPGCVGVLVMLDGEGEPVCEAGPGLLRRASGVSRAPVRVALAEDDFEDWMYASAETLGLADLEYDASADGAAEIKRALRPGSYTKPVDQPRLAHRVDLQLARGRSHSLDRMIERFDELRGFLPSLDE